MRRGRSALGGIALLAMLGAGSDAAGQVLVQSFAELKPYLNQNNVEVAMAPGTYRITPADVSSGLFSDPTLLSFTGTNSVFDFSRATFEVETEVFQAFGNVQVIEIALWGDDLVLKGLTMKDLGTTRPYRTALGVLLDGRRNRVEGFDLTVRGSYPYGYGDIFGKGSGYVIKHFKHSAVLIRGDDNHLKDCRIIHRAYGHGIFCQGSLNARIEGCYVEGEMRTSDDVLAEVGSGSAADEKDFMTAWGYRLQPGWMFSLQEDGIRAYNTGSGPDGTTRNTRNMEVIDCTVKNMRSGVTIGFCDNTKYVEGCVVLGNENGYWVGTGGNIVACSGNAQYGPLVQNNYQHDRDSVVDLTVLDPEDRYGNEILAYIGGSRHQLTLRGQGQQVDPDLRIMLGGLREGLRFHEVNPTYNDFSASNVSLQNLSLHPVALAEKCSGATGVTGGPVTDSGSGNSLASVPVDSCGGFGVLQTIQAEDFCGQQGVVIERSMNCERYVGSTQDGDWIRFDDLFFGSGPNRFEARVTGGDQGGEIELRLDHVDGELIGTCRVPATQDPRAWTPVAIRLAEPRGNHDLYLVFKGSGDALPDLDAFRFTVSCPGQETVNGVVGHWPFDEGGGSVAADSSAFSNTGSVTGAQWVAGIDKNALYYDGASSTVAIPPESFDPIHAEISVALWAYGGEQQPQDNSVLFALDRSNNRVLSIHLPFGNRTVYWDAGYESGEYDRISKLATDEEFKGAWTHWVFCKNSVFGHMRIYRNGELWHAEADTWRPITGIASAAIGSQITSTSYEGILDDVRLYDVELTAPEVTELYASYFHTDSGTPYPWLDDHNLVSDGDYDAADRLDADGDGASNGAEYWAGTNPTNAASLLRIVRTGERRDEVLCEWSAVSEKTYAVWSKADLGDGAFALEQSGIPGYEPTCSATVRTAGVAGSLLVEVMNK